MKQELSQKKERMPPAGSGRSWRPAPRQISIAPVWKLNYHIWVLIAWVFLFTAVLDMFLGWFPFVVHVNSIALMMEIAASAIVCHGAERYLTCHRARKFTKDRRFYLFLVYLAVAMMWMNLFLDGLYWENGVTALVYLAGRTYLEKKGRTPQEREIRIPAPDSGNGISRG